MPEKSIILVRRKDGLSRDAFRDHYERAHVPLALEWFGFDKYVRNHVAGDGASFDCLAEFWPHDPDQVRRAAEAGAKVFADDDALFMRAERRGGLVDEVHLAGPARGFDAEGAAKTILLVAGSDPAPLAAWAEAEVAAGRAARVTADRPRAGAGNLGDGLIVHVWNGRGEVTAPPGEVTERVGAIASDTPEATLAAARRTLKPR